MENQEYKKISQEDLEKIKNEAEKNNISLFKLSDGIAIDLPVAKLINSDEFKEYSVEWREDKGGYSIVNSEKRLMFGLGFNETKDSFPAPKKAFLDYWCMHMNLAYMKGYLNKDGKDFLLHQKTWDILDGLYEEWTGIKLNK